MSEPLLTVENLHAGYTSGIDVLQGLSLTVARGSLTLIIGPNGAGKSTLLKVLFGFLKPHRGRIRFAGAPIDGLEPYAVSEPAGALSGGQGRMLSVAREMMAAPALMLVDEPTAGLAPALVDQVYELLQTARRSIGATILLVDQNVGDAVRQADYVYMLDLGRIRAEGPARDFSPGRVSGLFKEALLG